MSRIINFTPHDIKIISESGEETVFQASGKIVRAATGEQRRIRIENFDHEVVNPPIFCCQPADFPPVSPDTESVIVSMPVKQWVHQQQLAPSSDLKPITNNKTIVQVLGPDTGPLSSIRDENGQVTGVKRLIYYGMCFWPLS